MEIKSVIEETNTQTNLHALCKYTDHANFFLKNYLEFHGNFDKKKKKIWVER